MSWVVHLKGFQTPLPFPFCFICFMWLNKCLGYRLWFWIWVVFLPLAYGHCFNYGSLVLFSCSSLSLLNWCFKKNKNVVLKWKGTWMLCFSLLILKPWFQMSRKQYLSLFYFQPTTTTLYFKDFFFLDWNLWNPT